MDFVDLLQPCEQVLIRKHPNHLSWFGVGILTRNQYHK
jgi:hypothetical protein